MTDNVLISQHEAEPKIAEMFEQQSSCELSVRDEQAFQDQWLSLGDVVLVSSGQADGASVDAVRRGAFEWSLPQLEEARANLFDALKIGRDGKREASLKAVARAMDEIASTPVRVGLTHPIFDPAALEEMPFRRSTTVVSDTSGVLQGGLDFVARHLHPAARVKIPAIVHMEIVNFTERFFSIRRGDTAKPARRISLLLEHLKSQGGHRTLLRIELQTDTEVERTYLLGDPLRSAFQPERDSSLSDLNISTSIRAYVDRLIVEAARHHQAQSSPEHAVRLLTSDQGLARMALAEGVKPLYFVANGAANLFGERLSGKIFDPFSGYIRETPLSKVLWELATAFGSVRLKNGKDSTFELAALGRELSWAPYHAKEDLLWCRHTHGASARAMNGDSAHVGDAEERSASSEIRSADANRRLRSASGTPLRFSVDRIIRLICVLDDRVEMTAPEVAEVLEARGSRGGDEYRRFLQSASLVSVTSGTWRAEGLLQRLSAALRHERVDEVREVLLTVPSFAAFSDRVRKLSVGRTLEVSTMGRGGFTYRVLGEVTLICASVSNADIFPTPTAPDAAAFARIALSRFSALDGGDGLVATGAWLESLIRHDGIHPEIARRRLQEASELGFLRRSTEGSTTQMRFDDRIVHVLRTKSGRPMVEPVHLYRGDYLIPGKGSVSLRIEEPQQ